MKCGYCKRPLTSRQAICDCGEDPFSKLVLGSRYELLGKIAEGGMGMIYRARDLENDQLCAVKISRWVDALKQLRQLDEEEAEREEEARVKREVTLLQKSASQSEHIVQVYGDYGSDFRVGLWYPMEFLEGTLLSQHPKYKEKFPPEQAVKLMLQLTEALGLAQGLGVGHRDLNPDNIFIVRRDEHDEFIKLIDFGIARNLYHRRKLFDTGENLGLGHLHYLSPEQIGYSAKDGCYKKGTSQKLDHRADLYSLGCIMFHMLCGYPPFLNETFEDLPNRDWDFPPGLEKALEDGSLPEDLRDLVMSCLDPDPDKRLPDLYVFRDNLQIAQRRLLGLPSNEAAAFSLTLTVDFDDENGFPINPFGEEPTAPTPPPPPAAAKKAPPPPPIAAKTPPPPPQAATPQQTSIPSDRGSSKIPLLIGVGVIAIALLGAGIYFLTQ